MNILQIAPYFPPYLGGQEKYIYLLSRQLKLQGHNVAVLTSNYPENSSYEVYDGISVYRKKCFGRPLRNPITPGLFFPAIDMDAFDLVHTHNEHSSAAMAAMLLKNANKKPLVVTCHGKLVFDRKLPDAIRDIYWKSIGRSILRSATYITVATPSEKKRLISDGKLPPDKIKVIPVGIDIKQWDALSSREIKEPFLDGLFSSGRPVLLVATQLIQRKGIQYLLEALPQIINEFPKLLCVIAGTGDYENRLRTLASSLGIDSSVQFIGLLNDMQLANSYQRADVFILPSLSEGQPTCIMEAWAFSCPVVATRIEGVIDYYSDCALLAEPGNSESLAEKILQMLSDREFARKLGKEGRKLIEEKFTWEKISAQMIDVYETCIEGRDL